MADQDALKRISLLVDRIVRITIGGDLAGVEASAPAPAPTPTPPPPTPTPPPPPASVAYVPYATGQVVENDGKYNAWPVACKLANGNLITVYTKANNHHLDDSGQAIGKISTDGGVTWGGEFTVYASMTKFSSAYGVSQISTGRIFVVLFRDDPAISLSGEAGLVYSDDMGSTWSAWVDLTIPSGFTAQAFGAGPVVQLSDGSLVATVEGTDTGIPVVDRTSKLVRSTDLGLTWGSPVVIAAYGVRPYYESKIVRLDGTNLICMHRSSDASGDIYRNFSTDNGATWDTPDIAFPGHGAPNTCRMANKELVCVQRRNGDSSCSAFISRDNGVTWPEETLIDNTFDDVVYGCPLPLTDQQVCVIYSAQVTGSSTDAIIKQAILYQLFAPVVGFDLSGGSVVTSNANAVAYSTSGNGAARSNTGHSSGHYYLEMMLVDGDRVVLLGLARSTATLGQYPGVDADGYAYYANDGQKYNNNTGTSYGATATNGTVIGIEYNDGTITFYNNGVSQGVAFSGITGTLYPSWGPGSSTVKLRSIVVNCGGTPFRYPIPAGASSWS